MIFDKDVLSIAFEEKGQTHNFLVRRSSNFRALSVFNNKTGSIFFFNVLSSKVIQISDLKHDKLRKNSYFSTSLVDTSHFATNIFLSAIIIYTLY